MKLLEIKLAARFAARFPDIGLATADVKTIARSTLQSRLDFRLPPIVEDLRATKGPAQMTAYDSIFEQFSYRSPLPKQLRLTIQKGFPLIDPLMVVMLAQELRYGVLIGAHDADRIEGGLTFDLAAEGESYEGMRGPIQCKENEIVARDARSIAFSYFQGADDRTCVAPSTESVVYFALGAPGMSVETLKLSLEDLVAMIGDAAQSAHIRVHR